MPQEGEKPAPASSLTNFKSIGYRDGGAYSFIEAQMEPLLGWPTQDVARLTRADIVRWWEARRTRFNLYVGAMGVMTWLLVLVAGSAAVKPGVDFEEPLAMIFGPFVYALMANICYTLGWVVDTVAFRGAPRIRFYKTGIVFSVVLTALPGVWALIAWLITLITGQKFD